MVEVSIRVTGHPQRHQLVAEDQLVPASAEVTQRDLLNYSGDVHVRGGGDDLEGTVVGHVDPEVDPEEIPRGGDEHSAKVLLPGLRLELPSGNPAEVAKLREYRFQVEELGGYVSSRQMTSFFLTATSSIPFTLNTTSAYSWYTIASPTLR